MLFCRPSRSPPFFPVRRAASPAITQQETAAATPLLRPAAAKPPLPVKPQDTSGNEILIGHYASMTGDNSTFGVETEQGARLAEKQINAAGGVLGKKIKIETQDDQSKPEEAKTVATGFAANPKVVAVIGEVSSGRSLAAGPVFQRAGIPMVSPASTNPDVTKIGDYIFRVCFIDPFQGYVMAKFAHDDLKATKVAIMRDQANDYSVGLANVFTEEFPKLGGRIALDVSYSGKDSDFRSQLAQIKASGADAIFIPGYYSEIGPIARQAREQGITVPLLGGDGWDSEKLIEGGGAARSKAPFSQPTPPKTPGTPASKVRAGVSGRVQKGPAVGQLRAGLRRRDAARRRHQARQLDRARQDQGRALPDQKLRGRDRRDHDQCGA
jgi:ABC-type branched-subunit amino acid transport system substrate-binding protein